jgi:hypothetical protein
MAATIDKECMPPHLDLAVLLSKAAERVIATHLMPVIATSPSEKSQDYTLLTRSAAHTGHSPGRASIVRTSDRWEAQCVWLVNRTIRSPRKLLIQ